MAFHKWTQPTGRRRGFSIGSDGDELYSSSVEDAAVAGYQSRQDRRNIIDATDRISKVLEDIDRLYGDDQYQDSLLTDLSQQVNDMENGQLKMQMKSFITQYKDMTTRVEEVNLERDEILESLAEWFNMDHLGIDFGRRKSVDGGKDDSLSFFSNLKVELGKLQHLKKDTDHSYQDPNVIEREKKVMRENIVKKFKKIKDVAVNKKKEEVQEPNVEKAWKHAATEICSLLQKVRDDGTDSIQELEAMLKKLMGELETETNRVQMLETDLRNSKMMENQWKNESMSLTSDNRSLNEKCERFANEIKRLRKLKTQEKCSTAEKPDEMKSKAVDTKIDEENDEEKSPTQDTSKSMKKKIKTLQEENKLHQNEIQELKELIEGQKEMLSEKQNLVVDLEQDKAGLIRQMEKENVELDSKHKSVELTGNSDYKEQDTALSDSTTPFKTKSSEVLCSKCFLQLKSEMSAPLSPHQSAATKTSISGSDLKVSGSPTEHRSESSSISALELELEAWRTQCAEHIERITELEGQLARTYQDLATIRQTGAASKTSLRSQVSNSKSTSRKETPNKQTVNQKSKTSLDAGGNSNAEKRRKIQLDCATANTIPVKNKRIKEQSNKISTGMQTDPKLDPIGSWSRPVYKEDSWRPPMPPEQWVDFDPTFVAESGGDSDKGSSIALTMLKGGIPSDVRTEADTTSSFVQRELNRITQGICGFVDYTNKIVEREATMMVEANLKLMEQLTDTEQMGLKIAEGSDEKLSKEYNEDFFLTAVNAKDNDGTKPELFDRLNPIESKLKESISNMGKMAIEQMRKAFDYISKVLQTEQTNYERIFTTIQKRKNSTFPDMLSNSGTKPTEHELRATINQTSTEEIQTDKIPQYNKVYIGDTEKGRNNAELPNHKKQTNIDNGRLLTILNIEDRFGQSHQAHLSPSVTAAVKEKSAPVNREEFQVSTATVPKQGLIQLVSKAYNNNDLIVDKPVIKKTRPLPLTHKKLQTRQQRLVTLNKTRVDPTLTRADPTLTRADPTLTRADPADPRSASNTPARKRTRYEPPKEEDYATYTLADLEQRMDQIADESAKENRHNLIKGTVNKKAGSLKESDKIPSAILPPIDTQTNQHKLDLSTDNSNRFPSLF